MPDVTQLLNAIEAGDANAASQLMPLVYDELRRLAAGQVKVERKGRTSAVRRAIGNNGTIRLFRNPLVIQNELTRIE